MNSHMFSVYFVRRRNDLLSSSFIVTVVEDGEPTSACGGVPAPTMATVKAWSPSNTVSFLIGMGVQSV